MLHGPAKAEAIKALAAREGLDLTRCSAYSDSFNDLPMLSMVGPIAINPDARLRAHAKAQGWRVRDYRTGRKAARAGLVAPPRPAVSAGPWRPARPCEPAALTHRWVWLTTRPGSQTWLRSAIEAWSHLGGFDCMRSDTEAPARAGVAARARGARPSRAWCPSVTAPQGAPFDAAPRRGRDLRLGRSRRLGPVG